MSKSIKSQIDTLFKERKLIRDQLYEALVMNNENLELQLADELARIRDRIISLYRVSKRLSE